MYEVFLYQQVLPSTGRAFVIEKAITLPIAPFVGLYIQDSHVKDGVYQDEINKIVFDIIDNAIIANVKVLNFEEDEECPEEEVIGFIVERGWKFLKFLSDVSSRRELIKTLKTTANDLAKMELE